MSYYVEHVRFTLECDACGLTEKRDLDATPDQSAGIVGWGEVRILNRTHAFCCPDCLEKVNAILEHRVRAAQAAQAAKEAACAHDYQQRGMLAQCTKCQRWK